MGTNAYFLLFTKEKHTTNAQKRMQKITGVLPKLMTMMNIMESMEAAIILVVYQVY